MERHLTAIAANAIPVATSEQLKNTCRANTVRCLYLTADLLQILKLFREHEIPALPYKGPVLAAQAYGDVALREFDDLDIMLRQRDIPRAHEIILSLGYKPKFDWILSPELAASLVPGEYNYRDEPRHAMVELHTEITLRHFPIKPDLDYFIARRAPVRLSDHEVLTFTAEDLLPMLCIHGSKDFWERFSWVADVSELIQSQANLDWDEIIRVTKSLGAERMVHTGLALAHGLLRAPLPSEILQRVQADRTACEIASEMQGMLLEPACADTRYGWKGSLPAPHAFRFLRRMAVRGAAGCGSGRRGLGDDAIAAGFGAALHRAAAIATVAQVRRGESRRS